MYVREFIKLMGGRATVAKFAKVTPRAVGAWYKNGIPDKHAYAIAERCAVSGAGFNEYTAKFISELERE